MFLQYLFFVFVQSIETQHHAIPLAIKSSNGVLCLITKLCIHPQNNIVHVFVVPFTFKGLHKFVHETSLRVYRGVCNLGTRITKF